MTWQKKCDQCENATKDRHLPGWLQVELVTRLVEGEGEYEHENPEFDFCSFACLAEWAQDAERRATHVVMEKLGAPV